MTSATYVERRGDIWDMAFGFILAPNVVDSAWDA